MSKTCVICHSVESNYKCPKCCAHYCSVACCKLHNAENCELPKSTTVEDPREDLSNEEVEVEGPQFYPGADAVDICDMQSVSKDHLQKIIENPQLKSFREHMTGSTHFVNAMTKAVQETILLELSNCDLVESDKCPRLFRL